MRKTELDKYLDSIRVVNPKFKLKTGKQIVFADIQENGLATDGVINFNVDLLIGTVKQINRELGGISTTNYIVELLDGSIKRVDRSQVIEVI